MSELIVNLPESGSQEIKDLGVGNVFHDLDGDLCVRLESGILSVEESGAVVVYTLEELKEYPETFGGITLCPEFQCTINIERI